MNRTLVRLGGVVWCVIAAVVPPEAVGGSTGREAVPPGAVRTWAEIVGANARVAHTTEAHPLVVERPQFPAAQPVRVSGTDQAASNPQPPTAGPSCDTAFPLGESSLIAGPLLDFDAILDNDRPFLPTPTAQPARRT